MSSGRHFLLALAMLSGLLVGRPADAVAAPDCRCRYFGAYFGLGDTVCFRTSKGMRVARCTLNQNVTSWEVTKRACSPISRLKPGRGAPATIRASRTNFRPARYVP